MIKTDTRFSYDAIEYIQDAVAQAQGNEVFFICKADQGRVVECQVHARGNQSSVPAIVKRCSPGNVIVHNHPGGNLTPSEADLFIASKAGNDGIGFFIVNNSVEDVYVVTEPYEPQKTVKIVENELAAVLEPDGELASRFADYEYRSSQVNMLKAVSKGFNESKICCIEAGTGVGKSFAYLLPGITWSELNDQKVVISTATINLQQQLIEKDIPFASSVLNSKIKAVLVKGRGNYLCKLRLMEVMDEADLFKETDPEIKQIYDWSKTTKDGSRSDLSFLPSPEVWARVASDSDRCRGLKCSFREQCFFMKARKEAASANILVVNHHLLFSDIALRKETGEYESSAVLPGFKNLIIDEAHSIEDSASSFFSLELNRNLLRRTCGQLYRTKKDRSLGLYRVLKAKFPGNPAIDKIPHLTSAILEQMNEIEAASRLLLEGNLAYRLIPGNQSKELKRLLTEMGELEIRILALINPLSVLAEKKNDEEEEDGYTTELKAIIRRLSSYSSVCQQYRIFDEKPDYVFWFERGFSKNSTELVNFHATPLSIAAILAETVFSVYSTVVCTSATLTVTGKFYYWMSRTGACFVDPERILAAALPSPFNYAKQVMLTIPSDAPEPRLEEYQGYLITFIRESVLLCEGKALILFTSYKLLRSVYDAVHNEFNQAGIRTLKQGEADRARLLEDFKNDVNSVLFATDSFWQGVDTPGDALKLLIITRLPFQVPTDPVIQARAEYIEKKGGKPFFQYSLPHAIIRLKQGFGRLMRKESDSGIVAILDSRILSKRYGKMFLQSLPPARTVSGDFTSSMREIEEFLY